MFLKVLVFFIFTNILRTSDCQSLTISKIEPVIQSDVVDYKKVTLPNIRVSQSLRKKSIQIKAVTIVPINKTENEQNLDIVTSSLSNTKISSSTNVQKKEPSTIKKNSKSISDESEGPQKSSTDTQSSEVLSSEVTKPNTSPGNTKISSSTNVQKKEPSTVNVDNKIVKKSSADPKTKKVSQSHNDAIQTTKETSSKSKKKKPILSNNKEKDRNEESTKKKTADTLVNAMGTEDPETIDIDAQKKNEMEYKRNKSNLKRNENSIRSDSGSNHFVAFLFFALLFTIVGYIVFQKRKKILGYLIEGRRTTRGRRTSGTKDSKVSYKPLDSEDKEAGNTDFKYVY